jgi:hypothetical protein
MRKIAERTDTTMAPLPRAIHFHKQFVDRLGAIPVALPQTGAPLSRSELILLPNQDRSEENIYDN